MTKLAAIAILLASMGLAGATSARADDRVFRVTTFGTSLTARGGWQKPLQDALTACMRRPVTVDTVALSGSTSDWGLANVGKVSASAPDVVLVEFYANDAALNRWIGVSTSRDNIAAILGRLRSALPNARIYGMGMNPFLGRLGWARPFLGRYVAAHRAAAEAIGNGFIDFGPLWARLSSDELEKAIPDGSHPRPDVASGIIVPELVRRLAPDCGQMPAKAG